MAKPGPTLRPWRAPAVVVIYGVVFAVAVATLDWDLAWLSDSAARTLAVDRLFTFARMFGQPDLSASMLHIGLTLTLSTLSTAVWGTVLGIGLGYVLALGASRAVVDGPRHVQGRRSSWARLVNEICRIVLDVLRGVPDFAWAVLILTGPGPGAVTGILALAISVAGTLGRVYSELWDSVDPRQYAVVAHAGGGRLATFAFGLQPLAARSMLSFTLMRAECTVRNASVIGVVGGGGLGGQLFDEFNFGRFDRVATLLLFLLVLTASVDLGSNLLRHRLSQTAARGGLRQALRQRLEVTAALLLGLAASAWWLGEAWHRAAAEMGRIEWSFIVHELGQIIVPDLRITTLVEALESTWLPLAVAYIATLLASLVAAAMVLPGSLALQLRLLPSTTSRSRITPFVRGGVVATARAVALGFRALPEVAWLLLAASCFRLGVFAGVLAIALHSTGILARVFVEIADDIPPRRFEPFDVGSRVLAFAYVTVPTALRDWRTYAVVQFESNVRAGLVLGIVGIGGLGDAFHTSFSHWSLHRASTFLITMVLLTACIDRYSRRVRAPHVRVDF